VQTERFSVTYIEKILQKLRAAKIITSQAGNQGGHALARPASQITLKEIVEALEGKTFDVFCEPNVRKEIVCTHFGLCLLTPIWEETKKLLDRYYDSLTLEMIAKGGNGTRNNGGKEVLK
jgi:Rrf2 family protein